MPVVSHQEDSNGSSISSGLGEKESSSISSFDEYSPDNNTTSSSYTKEEPEPLIATITQQLETESSTETNATKKSKATRRKETSNVSKPPTLPPDLILPPKPPSKLQADFRPLTIPMLTKTEISACPSVRPAQLQSVSFTAGTFGSITTTNPTPMTRPHLSLSLSKKTGKILRLYFAEKTNSCLVDSTVALNNLDQILRQVTAPNEISAFLSTLGTNEDLYKEKKCDFCCGDFLPDSNHSSSSSLTSNHCVTCMSLPNPTTITCTFNPRDAEAKERLKLKFNKRTVQQTFDSPKSSSSSSSTANRNKGKPCDNNIDDLVRFIDGDDTTSTERTSKKKKKKKSTPKNPPAVPLVEPSPAAIEEKSTTQESPTVEPQALPSPPVEKGNPKPVKIEATPENNPLSPEEEVNWITISRKQSKHKPTSIPSLLAVPVVPPTNPKPKQSPTATKRKASKNPTVVQEKVITETVTNSKKPQTTTVTTSIAPPARPPTKVKTEVPSAWTTHEPTPVPPVASTSTLLATAPAFVPSGSLMNPNNPLPVEQPNASLYWNRDGYLLPPPPGPVQRPNSAFSAAPGPRCIRRPSPEPPTTAFPTYSPLNYTVGNSTSNWNETSERNSKESQWKYPYEEQQQPPPPLSTTTIHDDFPLYDPFNSGAGLTISPSLLLNNGLKGLACRLIEHFT